MNETAEKWDRVAVDYQRTYSLGQSDYSMAMLTFWESTDMLRHGMRVLDIGCGVGKYGVLLAKRACDVTLIDISGEMLRHAQLNMAEFTTPWATLQCDFNEVSGSESIFAEGFDFSISTMSPAIHDVNTVKKMSAMTRGWCFLTRFADWTQPGRDALFGALGLEAKQPMENMRDDCAALVQAVSAAGFMPRVKYVDYCWSDVRTPEQEADYILKNNFDGAKEKPDASKVIAAAYSFADKDGAFEDMVNTKVAWIYWNTREITK